MAAAIPTAFSAGYGFSKTSDCRQLKEIQLACVSGVENSCAALRGKPAGEDCAEDVECGGGNICFRSNTIAATLMSIRIQHLEVYSAGVQQPRWQWPRAF
jgi:hypothetical protein